MGDRDAGSRSEVVIGARSPWGTAMAWYQRQSSRAFPATRNSNGADRRLCAMRRPRSFAIGLKTHCREAAAR